MNAGSRTGAGSPTGPARGVKQVSPGLARRIQGTSGHSRRPGPPVAEGRPGPPAAARRTQSGHGLAGGAAGVRRESGGRRRRRAESAVAWEGFLCALCASIEFGAGAGGLRRGRGSAASRPVQPFRHSGERRGRPPSHARGAAPCASRPPGGHSLLPLRVVAGLRAFLTRVPAGCGRLARRTRTCAACARTPGSRGTRRPGTAGARFSFRSTSRARSARRRTPLGCPRAGVTVCRAGSARGAAGRTGGAGAGAESTARGHCRG